MLDPATFAPCTASATAFQADMNLWSGFCKSAFRSGEDGREGDNVGPVFRGRLISPSRCRTLCLHFHKQRFRCLDEPRFESRISLTFRKFAKRDHLLNHPIRKLASVIARTRVSNILCQGSPSVWRVRRKLSLRPIASKRLRFRDVALIVKVCAELYAPVFRHVDHGARWHLESIRTHMTLWQPTG